MSYHEAPDASGKAPEHRDAAFKGKARGAMNSPMERKQPKELYPLIKEARKYKTADEFITAQSVKAQLNQDGIKINTDGTVTLYHATSPEIKKKIESEGIIKGGSTVAGGMTGIALKPAAFFGVNKQWVGDTWGHGANAIIEVNVPAEYIRMPAQNRYEVYFEGGLKRGDNGIWLPTQPPRSTFYNKIAEMDLIDAPKLREIWKEANNELVGMN